MAVSCLLLAWVYLHQTWGFCKAKCALYGYVDQFTDSYLVLHGLAILSLNMHLQRSILKDGTKNRPFARSGHMVRNKLCWDANNAVGLSKQSKVGLDWYEFLCFGSLFWFALSKKQIGPGLKELGHFTLLFFRGRQ